MDEDMKIYLEAKFGGVHEKMDTIKEDVKGHSRTLYGEDGRNGIVGDLNDMKTTVRNTRNVLGAAWALLTAFVGLK